MFSRSHSGSMESHSLFLINIIKLEPGCEADNVHSPTRQMISDVQVPDKMDSQIPASVKIEQPEAYADCPGEDTKIHPFSQSCHFLQEQSQMDKKMVFGNIDWKLVKQELPDLLSDDKRHGLSKLVGMTSCSFQEMAGHNETESRIPEDTTLIDHQELSLIETENGYTASQQHEHVSPISESGSSLIDINTKLSSHSENCQLHHVESPVKHTQISGAYLDYTVGYPCCGPKRILGDTPHMSEVCNVNISLDAFLHRDRATDTQENYKCDICSASFTEDSQMKLHMRTHTAEKPYKCDICAVSFTEAGSLKCHIRAHAGEKPYKCNICADSFTEVGSLKCHVRTHTEEKLYKCNICAVSFTRARYLKQHMRTHTGEKPFKCDVCGTSFTHNGYLKRHMRTHAREKPFKCDICGVSLSKAGHLKRHMRTHTGEKPYKCDICGAQFAQNSNLKCHMRIHTAEKPYKCDICGTSFTQTSNLKCHMRSHSEIHPCSQTCPSLQEQLQIDKKMLFGNIDWKLMKQELPDILCEDKSHGLNEIVGMTSCNFQEMAGHKETESRMPEDTTLIDHQELSLIGTENGYTASQQHEHFSPISESGSSMIDINTKLSSLNENCQLHHVETPVKHTQTSGTSLDYTVGYTCCSPQRIPEGDTPHMSDVCDVNISVDTFLHRDRATDTQEKLYKCDICSASFTEASQVKLHMKTHTGEKPYKCNICADSFTEVGSLKCHVRTHTKVKPYKRKICGTSFTQTDSLKSHMRTHTGEKHYKCDICAAAFTEAGSLKGHMRIHTGEKPCECDICGASFPRVSNLYYHKKTHTLEKPFQCDSCAASFIEAGGLKCHVRTHTGEKPYKCDICGAAFTQTGSLKCHMRIHTGEKPYMCDSCGASFARNAYLQCHMITHTGEKPYKCTICAASFTKSSHLKRHIRTHTREKPYMCDVCGTSFTQNCNLTCHMRIHTK